MKESSFFMEFLKTKEILRFALSIKYLIKIHVFAQISTNINNSYSKFKKYVNNIMNITNFLIKN